MNKVVIISFLIFLNASCFSQNSKLKNENNDEKFTDYSSGVYSIDIDGCLTNDTLTFLKDGKLLTDTLIKYDKNNVPNLRKEWKNGKRHGKWFRGVAQLDFNDGIMSPWGFGYEGNYSNGNKTGEWKISEADLIDKRAEGNYDQAKRIGVWSFREYGEDGFGCEINSSGSGNYIKGEKNGKWVWNITEICDSKEKRWRIEQEWSNGVLVNKSVSVN